jgi:hypothetical protein
MAAAAIFANGATLPFLRFLDPACLLQSVYQTSSKLGNKWPSYSISLIFKMTASAIFENGATLPVLLFSNSSCFFQSVYQVSSISGNKCQVNSFNWFFKPKHAKTGVMKLFWGAKTPFWGQDKRY